MTMTQSLSPSGERTLDSADDALSRSASIVPDNEALTKFYHEQCTYLPAMLGWFIFSALLTAYNKYVFGDGHMAFPCPLFLTSLHFLVQWSFSHFVCECFPETMGRDRVRGLDWKSWALVSIPCGFVTALDVGLSNLSLAIITITFYTMVKSSAPIFVLAWAFIFRIEKITLTLIGVAAVIAVGEFVTVAGEVDFILKGFILCLIATVCSGARWTLVQLKLQSMQPPMKTTIATMRLLSPSMFFGMLFMSIVIEQPWNDFAKMDSDDLLQVLLLGLGGGTIAVAMILCEFYLILEASAVIMMIGGVIKEMVTILLGVTAFGDELNATKIIGMCIVFSGVILYKISFHREKKENEAGGIYQQVGMVEIPDAEADSEANAEEMEEVPDGPPQIT